MRLRLLTLLAVALLGQTLASGAATREGLQTFPIDPVRSEVRFTVTRVGMTDVTGIFRESAGEIRWDPSEPEASSVWWRIKVASVLTDEPNRDSTLQNREYFDSGRHPDLIFESTHVHATGPGVLDVRGRLTLRGHTRPITVAVRHSGTATAPVFETEFEIDRYDFGVVGGRVMGRLIGRAARIHLRAVGAAPGTNHSQGTD